MANPALNNSDLVAGIMLGGKYRLVEEIGRGAMGTVWSAIHETLGQHVAIKVISGEHADSDELRKRFDTEARAAAKLRSRFVVGVYDNGLTNQGLPYIVMEYLEGECLEDRIVRQGSISVADTSRIARHVSRALAKAHSHGIVHRDLKPANIFITKSDDEDDGDDWTAKVLDFGIAKMDDFGDRSTTKTGAVLGTPLFMSPEQVRGASTVDARADLYSFGMVIYNMLTGTYAFEGQSFGDLLVSICTDPLPVLSRSAPQAPPALDAWFHRACARDPDDRYQTADEFMDGLTHAIGDTTPGSRLSQGEISVTDHLMPLAQTFAARSDIAESGSRQIDTGASAHTIAVPLAKKSKLPLIVGAVAIAIAVIALITWRGEEESDGHAVGASQAARPKETVALPDPPVAEVVDLDAVADKTASEKPSATALPAQAPAGEAPKTDTATKPTPSRGKPGPKPPTAASTTAPQAAPQSKPTTPTKSAEPDVGF